MEEDLIKVTPNKEKAQSILKMVDTTIEMIKGLDKRNKNYGGNSGWKHTTKMKM